MEDDNDEPTPNDLFLDAVRCGDIQEVSRLLASGGVDPHVMDEWTGSNALHFAAANGHIDMLKLLLLANPDLKVLPIDFRPEMFKRKLNAISVVREAKGFVKQHKPNFSGNTPLLWALQQKQWKTATLLMMCCYDQIDVLHKNEFGQCALFIVSSYQPQDAATEKQLALLLQIMYEHPSASALEVPQRPTQEEGALLSLHTASLNDPPTPMAD